MFLHSKRILNKNVFSSKRLINSLSILNPVCYRNAPLYFLNSPQTHSSTHSICSFSHAKGREIPLTYTFPFDALKTKLRFDGKRRKSSRPFSVSSQKSNEKSNKKPNEKSAEKPHKTPNEKSTEKSEKSNGKSNKNLNEKSTAKNEKSNPNSKSFIRPPVAEKVSFVQSAHGVSWNDDYRWMENLSDPKVMNHLEKENAYANACLMDTNSLQRELIEEMKGYIPLQEESPPERIGNWYYFSRIPVGKEFPVFFRTKFVKNSEILPNFEISNSENSKNGPLESSNYKKKLKQKTKKNYAQIVKDGFFQIFLPNNQMKVEKKHEVNNNCYTNDNDNNINNDDNDEINEEVILDANQLAENFGYVHIASIKISPNHNFLAYLTDISGSENFKLFVKDLTDSSNTVFRDVEIADAVSMEWANNSFCLFYTIPDKMQKPFKLVKTNLNNGEEKIIFELNDGGDDDDAVLDISKTKDLKYITININSKFFSEVYLLDADNPDSNLLLIEKRQNGVHYFVEHNNGWLYILTNSPNSDKVSPNFDKRTPNNNAPKCLETEATNSDFLNSNSEFRLVVTNINSPGKKYWKQIVSCEEGSFLEDIDMFQNYCVIYRRCKGTPQIAFFCVTDIIPTPENYELVGLNDVSKSLNFVPLPENNFAIVPGANQEFKNKKLRFSLSSPLIPESTFDFDLETKKLFFLQQQKIPILEKKNSNEKKSNKKSSKFQTYNFVVGSKFDANFENFKPDFQVPTDKKCSKHFETNFFDAQNFLGVQNFSKNFEILRFEAQSLDEKVSIPISVLRSKTFYKNGQNPCLLIGYGAYGKVSELDWNCEYFVLLNRGWSIAVAHVRGGGELGKTWHRFGQLEKKENSFLDFIACSQKLIKEKIVHENLLSVKGMSAGGMLVASSMNLNPKLFKSVILNVPFLDVLNTMLNENLSLTKQEYGEWGNPNQKFFFEKIKNYCPYMNIRQNEKYPAVLVSSSLIDTRVNCWEASKWISKLREFSISEPSTPKLLITNKETGHFGEGGKYQRLDSLAKEIAFLIIYGEK